MNRTHINENFRISSKKKTPENKRENKEMKNILVEMKIFRNFQKIFKFSYCVCVCMRERMKSNRIYNKELLWFKEASEARQREMCYNKRD